ncbi:MAG TPA: acyl-CoA dehydrogenase family protein [Candidatus Binatia bacterium]|nr:acyl-CoA dehydrogenase family protein [Candidatus Binatia bacterium]
MKPIPDYQKRIDALAPRFRERAAPADEGDRFVAENFADLKTHGLVAAGVPRELGGGDLSHLELCDMVRQIALSCGSTALAFSMHTHQVATNAWRWRHQKAPVDGLLKRVASENIVLLSSGGSDWLQGSGTATRVEGGYRINGRKIFSSGAHAGDLLMTSAIHEDPDAGPTVLHFAVPMRAEGVQLCDTWKVMGMRGTGSHDIELTDVFVADAAIGLKRPAAKWHLLFHIISMVAFPLIYSAYLGVAQAARDLVVDQTRARKVDRHTVELVGGMDNELMSARLALQDMIAAAATNDPGPATTNRVMIGRTLVARGVLKTVELAMEAAGGKAFYRSAGLERLFRDAQAARYHPLREGAQRSYSGRTALGLDVDEVM